MRSHILYVLASRACEPKVCVTHRTFILWKCCRDKGLAQAFLAIKSTASLAAGALPPRRRKWCVLALLATTY